MPWRSCLDSGGKSPICHSSTFSVGVPHPARTIVNKSTRHAPATENSVMRFPIKLLTTISLPYMLRVFGRARRP
jgi:hypothetical protein